MSDEVTIATPSQTVGPFFHFGLPPRPMDRTLATGDVEPISVLFRITDGEGQPVTDALVELWQRQGPAALFGRLATGEDGTCEFETVRSTSRSDASGQQHAFHVNVCLLARGLLRQIHTRVYFAGDPALTQDPVYAMVPENRRSTLLAHPDPGRPGRWVFHVRLQGDNETVFFDV